MPPKHSKKCRLVKFYHAFICYLYLLTKGNLETSQEPNFGSCPLATEGDEEDVGVEFDPKDEKIEVSKETLDASLTLASLANATLSNKQESPIERPIPLNCVPKLIMDGDVYYILLKDIMQELN